MIQRLKLKSKFSRNVLILMTGSTIAQAILIAISPILTRIYSPEDFGVLALFIAISAIFSTIANGKYDLAIMLPEKDEDAVNILALGFIINSIVSLTLLVIILLYGEHITLLLNDKEIGHWIYLTPISVFLLGIWDMLSYFNNRKKQYKILSNVTIIRSILLASFQLIIGFFQSGPAGLIGGSLFSQALANLSLIRRLASDKVLFSHITAAKIITLAKRYSHFPKFTMWSGLLNIASLQIPVILLGLFFSATIVGLFSLSHRVISIPMSVMGSSVSQVFYQRSVEIKNNKKELENLTVKTYKKLIQVGVAPFSIILVFGDLIFAFVFGSEWRIAGEYAQILSLWILLVFITSPLATLMLTLEKQKEVLYFNVSIFISRILSIAYGGFILKDAYQTILIFSVVGIIFFLFWIKYIMHLVSVNSTTIALFAIKYFLPVVGVLFFIRILL
jgi:lipopolysaccharide exporter